MTRWIQNLLLGVFFFGFVAANSVEPQRMPAPVNTEWEEKDPWLCPDGHTLLFSSNRGGADFDIYQTRWNGESWPEPVRLSNHVNTIFDEEMPSVTDDGRMLMFNSTRTRIGRGPWISQRMRNGCWSPAKLVRTRQLWSRPARISPDGKRVYYKDNITLPNGQREMKTLYVEYDPRTRFWGKMTVVEGELPDNNVPNARWRFLARDGDIWYENLGFTEPSATDRREHLKTVDQSGCQLFNGDKICGYDADNLLDGFEDTGWASKPGAPINQQWILLALNGPVRHRPGESRIHSLKIHAGPFEYVQRQGFQPPDRTGPGTRPGKLRILGGMELDALKELALADLEPDSGSPWHTIPLNKPTRLRYLKIEILSTVDPNAPFVAFNEAQVFGSGESTPPTEHIVSKDENNNITVNGKPFFPIYLYGTNQGDLENLAEWGFTTVLDGETDLDETWEHGLMAIAGVPGPDDEWSRYIARKTLWANRHHPALLGYMMSDESGGNEEIMKADERRAAFIKENDPNHFTTLNDLWPQHYARSSKIVDVFSIDPYPQIIGQPLSYQADAVEAAQEAVGRSKPILVVNASWHGGGGRLVSPRENRLLTYLALIHGAKGISWYAIEFSDAGQIMGIVWDYPDHWQSILRCVDEIHQLMPVLFAPYPKSDSPLLKATKIDNPNSRLDVMIKEVDGEVWMLAANCEQRPVSIGFSFGWADQIVMDEVMADLPFKRRTSPQDLTFDVPRSYIQFREHIKNAQPIRLGFDAYEVRVFRMKPLGPIDFHYQPKGRGRLLAVTNEPIRTQTFKKVTALRKAKKRQEARQLINDFWSEYEDLVSADDIGLLIDALGPASDPQEVLADYARLANENPTATGWPHWIFKIVNVMTKAGKRNEAQKWLDQLIQNSPDSIWRAQAEAVVEPASARSGRKPWTKAVRLQKAPTIDGKPDQPLWQNPTTFKNTTDLDPSRRPQDTQFAVGYDERAIYLMVRAIEPQPSRITARKTNEVDQLWEDDCIEVYIDHDLDCHDYAKLAFNARGAKFDGISDPLDDQPYYRQGYRLEVDFERKAEIGKDDWRVEVSIPFKDLNVEPPKPGQVWGFGIQRLRQVNGQVLTAWGNQRGEDHDKKPENFGFLIFE